MLTTDLKSTQMIETVVNRFSTQPVQDLKSQSEHFRVEHQTETIKQLGRVTHRSLAVWAKGHLGLTLLHLFYQWIMLDLQQPISI